MQNLFSVDIVDLSLKWKILFCLLTIISLVDFVNDCLPSFKLNVTTPYLSKRLTFRLHSWYDKEKYKYHHTEPRLDFLPSKKQREASVKKVLVAGSNTDHWLGIGGHRGCPVQECSVTRVNLITSQDMAAINVSDFDAVVISAPSFKKNQNAKYLLKSLQPFRTNHQRWIFSHAEAPRDGVEFINQKYLSKNVYNWTMTYRPDSDIYRPVHDIYVPKNAGNNYNFGLFWYPFETMLGRFVPSKDLHEKTRLVFWAVSHCLTMSKREDYVRELQKFIDVDIVGGCKNSNIDPEICPRDSRSQCLGQFSKKYKFYLSFENSICEEYITEKMERTIKMTVVPIVMGDGPYKRYYPEGSYIDVFDFKSPKKLAEYLLYLDKNNKEYLKYFKWKESYIGLKRRGGTFCELCAKLHDPTEPVKTYNDIHSWWFNYEDGTPICSKIRSALTFYSSNNQKRN